MRRADLTEAFYVTGLGGLFLEGLTAVSRKVVGKSARDNPERYCGWF